MFTQINADNGKVEVFVEKEDKCDICLYAGICPLIGAIQQEYVFLGQDGIPVETCGMFQDG